MLDIRPADILAPPTLWSLPLEQRNVPVPKPHREDCICPICLPRDRRKDDCALKAE